MADSTFSDPTSSILSGWSLDLSAPSIASSATNASEHSTGTMMMVDDPNTLQVTTANPTNIMAGVQESDVVIATALDDLRQGLRDAFLGIRTEAERTRNFTDGAWESATTTAINNITANFDGTTIANSQFTAVWRDGTVWCVEEREQNGGTATTRGAAIEVGLETLDWDADDMDSDSNGGDV